MNKLIDSSLAYYLSGLSKQIDEQCAFGIDTEIKKLLLKINNRLNTLYESDYSWAEDDDKADEIDGALSRLWGQLNLSAESWSVNKLTGIEKALHVHKK